MWRSSSGTVIQLSIVMRWASIPSKELELLAHQMSERFPHVVFFTSSLSFKEGITGLGSCILRLLSRLSGALLASRP